MTTITIDRATAQQALEAMRRAVPTGKITLYEWAKALSDLDAALAQQAEPVESITRLFGTLPVHDAQQAEPVEPVAHRVVAGALFDFMGWLTSRRERLVLSSIDDAAPAVDAIRDFAEMRGLSLDDAKVQDWNAALAQQAEPVEPVAWVGDPSTQDYASTVPDPQVEDRLARHGIPMPGDPK